MTLKSFCPGTRKCLSSSLVISAMQPHSLGILSPWLLKWEEGWEERDRREERREEGEEERDRREERREEREEERDKGEKGREEGGILLSTSWDYQFHMQARSTIPFSLFQPVRKLTTVLLQWFWLHSSHWSNDCKGRFESLHHCHKCAGISWTVYGVREREWERESERERERVRVYM